MEIIFYFSVDLKQKLLVKPIVLALMGGKILLLFSLKSKRFGRTAGNSFTLKFQFINSKFQLFNVFITVVIFGFISLLPKCRDRSE
jgi:hypothetical protein